MLSSAAFRAGGAYRDRHETWCGMRWTLLCLLTSGTEADGEVVWSCRPDAGDTSKRSESFAGATVANEHWFAEESAYKP